MSGLQLVSAGALGNTPKALVCADTTGPGLSFNMIQSYMHASNIKKILSGALTANTYKTLLSVTGAGVLNFMAMNAVDATSRTMTLRLTLDGGEVITRSVTTAVQYEGAIIAGSSPFSTTASGMGFDAIPFSTSMLVEVKSSVTETDKVAISYNYRTC